MWKLKAQLKVGQFFGVMHPQEVHLAKQKIMHLKLFQAVRKGGEESLAFVKWYMETRTRGNIVNLSDLTVCDELGYTPLMIAVERGDLPMVKELLDSPRPGYIDATNRNGDTALMLAARKGYKSVAEALLEKGPCRKNAGQEALNNKHYEIASLFCRATPEQLANSNPQKLSAQSFFSREYDKQFEQYLSPIALSK